MTRVLAVLLMLFAMALHGPFGGSAEALSKPMPASVAVHAPAGGADAEMLAATPCCPDAVAEEAQSASQCPSSGCPVMLPPAAGPVVFAAGAVHNSVSGLAPPSRADSPVFRPPIRLAAAAA